MFPKPKAVLVPNSYAYESEPMVKATGFREYDARWLFGKEINLMGVQALGMGLGALIAELGAKQEVVTGHDFRGFEQDRRHQDRERPIVDLSSDALGEIQHRPRRDLDDLDLFFGKAIQLTTDRMELARRRDDAPPLANRQRRQPPRDELVRVLPERDVIERVTNQPREARAHLCRLLCGTFPFVVDQLRRIQPRALLRVEADVGPRLV